MYVSIAIYICICYVCASMYVYVCIYIVELTCKFCMQTLYRWFRSEDPYIHWVPPSGLAFETTRGCKPTIMQENRFKYIHGSWLLTSLSGLPEHLTQMLDIYLHLLQYKFHSRPPPNSLTKFTTQHYYHYNHYF